MGQSSYYDVKEEEKNRRRRRRKDKKRSAGSMEPKRSVRAWPNRANYLLNWRVQKFARATRLLKTLHRAQDPSSPAYPRGAPLQLPEKEWMEEKLDLRMRGNDLEKFLRQ